MQVNVVTNNAGEIIAIAPVEIAADNRDDPIRHAVLPLEGQRVVVVDISDDLLSDDRVLTLHRSHRVDVADEPRLVCRRTHA